MAVAWHEMSDSEQDKDDYRSKMLNEPQAQEMWKKPYQGASKSNCLKLVIKEKLLFESNYRKKRYITYTGQKIRMKVFH